jgi:hypothetical protein
MGSLISFDMTRCTEQNMRTMQWLEARTSLG